MILDELNEKKSLQIDSITDAFNMPGKILNLNRIMINDFLDILQNKEYLIVNRTAGLDMVYPNRCKEYKKIDLLKVHYEGRTKS